MVPQHSFPLVRHRGAAIVMILVGGLTVSGCGSASSSERTVPTLRTATASPASEAGYRSCLRGHGVAFDDSGTTPEIDKSATSTDVMEEAARVCAPLAPAQTAQPGPDSATLKAARAYAVCLRKEGITTYPDPDPQTGEPALTDEQARELKGNPQLPEAMQACRSHALGTGRGTVGG